MATTSAVADIGRHVGARRPADVFRLARTTAALAREQLAAEWRTRVVFVDNAVAIIVHAIALLRDARMNRSIAIVAVVATTDLGTVTVDILVEQLKGADRARCLALDGRLAGVILPRRDALVCGGTSGRRHAPAFKGAVLARRTGGGACSWADGGLAFAAEAGVDGTGMSIVTTLDAGILRATCT